MAIPVLAEVPGVQELHTRDHGTVKVAGLSFMDNGLHIVKCPNGAYMHSNGLPVENEGQLQAAIPQPFLADALEWFNRRHEYVENLPQPIGFHPQGHPVFADGSIPDFSDLYAYFSPGPILTAAIVALQQYIDRTPGYVAQKLKAVPQPQEAPPPDPSIAANSANAMLLEMAAKLEAAEKALADEKAKKSGPRAAAKAKRSHKKTRPEAPAQAQEA